MGGEGREEESRCKAVGKRLRNGEMVAAFLAIYAEQIQACATYLSLAGTLSWRGVVLAVGRLRTPRRRLRGGRRILAVGMPVRRLVVIGILGLSVHTGGVMVGVGYPRQAG